MIDTKARLSLFLFIYIFCAIFIIFFFIMDIARQIANIRSEYLCPISKKKMSRPVVACDGITYDKKYIRKWFHNNQYFPIDEENIFSKATFNNKAFSALISVIEEEIDKLNRTFEKISVKNQRSKRTNKNFEKSIKRIESFCKCPISQEPIKCPVVACDGKTYEEEYILEWFQNNSTFPDGKRIWTEQIFDNVTLSSLILTFRKEVHEMSKILE